MIFITVIESRLGQKPPKFMSVFSSGSLDPCRTQYIRFLKGVRKSHKLFSSRRLLLKPGSLSSDQKARKGITVLS